jgi:hypothetical protein
MFAILINQNRKQKSYLDSTHFSDQNRHIICSIWIYKSKDMILQRYIHILPFFSKTANKNKVFSPRGLLAGGADGRDRG